MPPEQPPYDMPDTTLSEQPELDIAVSPDPQPSKRQRRLRWLLVFVGFKLLALVAGYFYIMHLNTAPADFRPQTITIEPGATASQIATTLATAGVVRSAELLQGALLYFQDPTQIKATTYTFTEPQTTTEVAEILVTGEFDNDLVTLTFIEGMRVQEYARTASIDLPNVSEAEFLDLAAELEGQLFPETYFVPNDFTTAELIELMLGTHVDILGELLATSSTTLTVPEILILASIVEREANTPESKRLVAGIFMNRIAIGMPLQADASIEYVIDTPLGELPPGQLAAELRELDSSYNTYLNPGLPPTPIGNPGRVALQAVIDPTPSEYFYYITGDDGVFYYAQTYDQHLVNIARHLR